MTNPKYLFHTTSLKNLSSILKQRRLRNEEGFISFSEKPLPHGDISAREVVLVLHASHLKDQLYKVEYTEKWAQRYPEHATYVGGEGWLEQYTPPAELYTPPPHLTDDEMCAWEPDEDALERHEYEAELQAFLSKSNEQEWVSRNEGQDVRIKPEAVKGVISLGNTHVKMVTDMLRKVGFDIPVITPREKNLLRAEADPMFDDEVEAGVKDYATLKLLQKASEIRRKSERQKLAQRMQTSMNPSIGKQKTEEEEKLSREEIQEGFREVVNFVPDKVNNWKRDPRLLDHLPKSVAADAGKVKNRLDKIIRLRRKDVATWDDSDYKFANGILRFIRDTSNPSNISYVKWVALNGVGHNWEKHHKKQLPMFVRLEAMVSYVADKYGKIAENVALLR